MNQTHIAEKLLKLLPHLARHCADHAHEIAEWQLAGNGILGQDVIDRLMEAGAKMDEARRALSAAYVVLSNEVDCSSLPVHDHSHN